MTQQKITMEATHCGEAEHRTLHLNVAECKRETIFYTGNFKLKIHSEPMMSNHKSKRTDLF